MNFENFETLNTLRNRCAGYTINGKRCRTRLKETQYLYCCEAHKPLNDTILEEGCFCCCEPLINHKDVIHFKCKHLMHKKCYYQWIKENSNYDEPICLLCRQSVIQHIGLQKKKKKTLLFEEEYNNEEIMKVINSANGENKIKLENDLFK